MWTHLIHVTVNFALDPRPTAGFLRTPRRFFCDGAKFYVPVPWSILHVVWKFEPGLRSGQVKQPHRKIQLAVPFSENKIWQCLRYRLHLADSGVKKNMHAIFFNQYKKNRRQNLGNSWAIDCYPRRALNLTWYSLEGEKSDQKRVFHHIFVSGFAISPSCSSDPKHRKELNLSQFFSRDNFLSELISHKHIIRRSEPFTHWAG